MCAPITSRYFHHFMKYLISNRKKMKDTYILENFNAFDFPTASKMLQFSGGYAMKYCCLQNLIHNADKIFQLTFFRSAFNKLDIFLADEIS